ncbi:uncharacterized protein LOC116305274 [Actinia tenebrosa]|uniref:Uncharacterized protein LOC116305274 n=1 Tax=Actinia tenebrosa TaxID=6105 RepID=A0A6P8IYI5_ACTTE|nr:uncharacterized protein LOC116305274 [Actinia tenebrosa]XP_031571015.1 uncharacterized protein LOC116305274 [Actinia tenebrosa]
MRQMLVLFALTLILSTEARGLGRKDENDLEKRLLDLTESEEPLAVERGVCEAQFVKVGCFKDNGLGSNKVLNELLFTDRSRQSPKSSGKLIDWSDYESYLKDLACRCAKAAKAKGYTHFGLQYYGECFSAPDASRVYARDGASSGCVNSFYQACNAEDSNNCVGKAHANFVYRIPEEGSGGGQVDYNGAYDA